MSIYSEVAKSVLLTAVIEQITRSTEKDAPSTGIVAFFTPTRITPQRDLELSRTKRDFLTGLKEQILACKEEANDLLTTRALLLLLTTCKTNIVTETQKKRREPGTTENLLAELIKFMTEFHKKSKPLKLTDQAHDKDAFSYFAIAVASYHAKRLLDDIQATTLQGVLVHPSLTPIVPFQQELDRVVNTAWLRALNNIERQKKLGEDASYKEVKNDLGITLIDYLTLKHQKMHSDYTISMSGLFGLLPYYLDGFLQTAAHAVSGHTSTCTFSAEAEDDLTLYEVEEVPLAKELST